MEVRELMTTNPFCLSVDETLQQVAQEMKRHDVGAMPVCVEGKLAGIITDRDMIVGCVAEGKQPQQSVVKDHMTADLSASVSQRRRSKRARLWHGRK